MPRSDSCSLVVPCSIASQLKNFSSQILQDSSKVHCRTFPHSVDPASLFQLSETPAHTTILTETLFVLESSPMQTANLST